LEKEIHSLKESLSEEAVWQDPVRSRELSVRLARQESLLESFRSLARRFDDLSVLIDLVREEQAHDEIPHISKDLRDLTRELKEAQLRYFLSGPYDQNNAFLSIHAGAGGTEAQDWVDMLLRMYSRWIENHHMKAEILSRTPGEEAGTKSVSLFIKGANAYGLLRSEHGVHRLVRISPFDANKRRHTSFALVEVIPEIPVDEVKIDPKDLRVDTFRASGPGGQYVNKTESAVRITHLPTGISVECQTERSQIQNRAVAMSMLISRLHQLEEEKREAEERRLKGENIPMGWGYQIRSYVLHPYKMVKDLRTRFVSNKPDEVLAGDLDPFIWAYLSRAKSAVLTPIEDDAPEP
jgi:peptide chain release factor 2